MKAITAGAMLALTATAAGAANTKNSALDAYTQCLLDASTKLDDGGSDPKTIALAVVPQCTLKRELMIADFMEVTDDPDARQGAAEGVRSAEIGIIIGMVLELRKVGARARRPSGPSAAGKK